MNWLTETSLAMPDPGKWALAIVGLAIGLIMILAPDRMIRGLRRWLLVQLRLVRRPGYRRMLKIFGWMLFVTGALLMTLLVLVR